MLKVGVRQGIPRERVNRTAARQAGSLLEVLYRNLDQWSKDVVNRKFEVRSGRNARWRRRTAAPVAPSSIVGCSGFDMPLPFNLRHFLTD